ncbi:MAG TPA: WGR domain-containing protein, partial [Polyangiaceae bacterium]
MSRCELVSDRDGSNKFWTLELDGKTHKIHFGKVGSAGQKKVKRYASEGAAKKDFDVVVAKKIKEGYRDAGGKAAKTSKTAKPEKPEASPVAVASAPKVDESITKSIGLG